MPVEVAPAMPSEARVKAAAQRLGVHFIEAEAEALELPA
jgi:hypothetical protein